MTSITPDSVQAGEFKNVTIIGSGFVEGAVVTFENGTRTELFMDGKARESLLLYEFFSYRRNF